MLRIPLPCWRQVKELRAILLETAQAMDDEAATEEIRDRITQVQYFVDETMSRFGPHRGLAHRVAAACAASLGEHVDAARHGCVAAELIPEDRCFSNQLAGRLRRAGYYEEARSLSRMVFEQRALNSMN